MKNMSFKKLIGYIMMICLLLFPAIMLAIRNEWVTDVFGILGVVCILMFLFLLSGKFINEK